LVPALALGAAALLGRILLGRRRGDAASDGGDAVPEAPPTPSPVLLEFADLTCTLQKKKAQHATTLLQSVSGSAAPGRLTAIMGPSGAGKTCVTGCVRSG
jgi:ABC-type multidrug transport system fused ATPase/permease subunit